ncbi:MAG: EF-P beta-lysylation protein EpmB [Mariniblastus sp.]|nr:EF-P beta-lysylation protein EpmB [Mariniblastus sp.]
MSILVEGWSLDLDSTGTKSRNDYSLGMSILANNSGSVRADTKLGNQPDWRQHMKSAIRDVETLRERLSLPKNRQLGAEATATFPVFVPEPFLSRMQPGDLNDPLLRQVLPVSEEDESPQHFSKDPLNEAVSTLQPGLLQKYSGRVLLITTGACAVHCRYCFRRHFPYEHSPVSIKQWQSAIDQIASDPSIEEVILSGGDPLTIVDARLAELIKALNSIPHLKRLRIHTRLPIMIPQRVTNELVEMLVNGRLQPIVVIHSNHANELDESVALSIKRLTQAGVMLLNQTVLLRGINDQANALIQLSKRLLDLRVSPYYLHQLDPVIGASHFEVSKNTGIKLIEQMRGALPGYAVPRYVKELAGEPNKTVWA